MKKFIVLTGALYLLVFSFAPRVVAYFSQGSYAIVVIGDDNEACYLSGAHKTDPLSLQPYLIEETGSRHYYNKDMLKYAAFSNNIEAKLVIPEGISSCVDS